MEDIDDNEVLRLSHYDIVLSGCENLTAVTLPDSLTEMGEKAFAGECNGGMFRGV